MNSNIVLLLVFVSVALAEECCAGDRNDLQVWPRARGTAYPRGWSADERIPMTTGQYQKLHQKVFSSRTPDLIFIILSVQNCRLIFPLGRQPICNYLFASTCFQLYKVRVLTEVGFQEVS
jgi:hypothetical protein